jgi:hypothetical protein
MLLAGIATASALSCGDDTPTEPTAVDVRVAYVSKLPAGCPDQANPCYPTCVHHYTPAGQQAIYTLWGSQEVLRLTQTAPGRYEGTLAAVPTNTTLQLYGRDIGVCCVDSCNYPPVLEDILLNGTRLTKVVTTAQPPGTALEFKVSGGGTIQN